MDPEIVAAIRESDRRAAKRYARDLEEAKTLAQPRDITVLASFAEALSKLVEARETMRALYDADPAGCGAFGSDKNKKARCDTD